MSNLPKMLALLVAGVTGSAWFYLCYAAYQRERHADLFLGLAFVGAPLAFVVAGCLSLAFANGMRRSNPSPLLRILAYIGCVLFAAFWIALLRVGLYIADII